MGWLVRSAWGYLCGVTLAASLGAAPPTLPGPDATPPAPDAPAYTVRLTRPARVGEKFNFVADASFVQSLSGVVSGRAKSLRPTSGWLHLEAVERVLEVSARGEPSKSTYTLTRCTLREGNAETEFLPPEAVLTVTAGRWKSRVEIDGRPITMREETILRAAVSLPNTKDISLDDAFGTAKARRVGESWPVNAEALARYVSRQGVTVKKDDVSGTVKLKSVQDVGGVPHVLVAGAVTIRQWSPDPAYLPQEAQFVSGSAELKFTKLVPLAATGPCLTDTYSEKDLVKMKTRDDAILPDVVADGKILRTSGIKRTPLRAEPAASGQE